jgi:hypothetical protein
MIGETIEFRRPFPVGAVLWLTIAIVCVALTFVTHRAHWAVFAILPASISLALFVSQPEEFHAELTDHGFMLGVTGFVPYQSIRRIWLATRGGKSVYVSHQDGTLRIPGTAKATPMQLLAFLNSVRPPQPFVQVHGAIAPYLQSQVQSFGLEKVFAHVARTPRFEVEGARSKAVIAAMFGTAAAWVIAAMALQEGSWAGIAALLATVALFALLIRNASSTVGRGVKNWQDSSLVIGPAGLALAQGDLKGELRWKEVREIKLRTAGGPAQRRVELKIHGAQINIMDFYESSLGEIHKQIDGYWREG